MFRVVKIIGLLAILFLLLSVGLFYFYWFHLRPSQIKHDCSWVKIVEKSKPGRPALTEKNLWKEGLLNVCPTTAPIPTIGASEKDVKAYMEQTRNNLRAKIIQSESEACGKSNQALITQYSIKLTDMPEKIYWRQATEQEYKFCIHNKGL